MLGAGKGAWGAPDPGILTTGRVTPAGDPHQRREKPADHSHDRGASLPGPFRRCDPLGGAKVAGQGAMFTLSRKRGWMARNPLLDPASSRFCKTLASSPGVDNCAC